MIAIIKSVNHLHIIENVKTINIDDNDNLIVITEDGNEYSFLSLNCNVELVNYKSGIIDTKN